MFTLGAWPVPTSTVVDVNAVDWSGTSGPTSIPLAFSLSLLSLFCVPLCLSSLCLYFQSFCFLSLLLPPFSSPSSPLSFPPLPSSPFPLLPEIQPLIDCIDTVSTQLYRYGISIDDTIYRPRYWHSKVSIVTSGWFALNQVKAVSRKNTETLNE